MVYHADVWGWGDLMHPNMTPILARLKEARKQRGLTQRQVANRLHMSTQSVCTLERGQRRLSVEQLLELCQLYRVSPEWILMGKNGSERS